MSRLDEEGVFHVEQDMALDRNQQLQAFRDLLLKRNERQNLISRRLGAETLEMLINESLMLAELPAMKASSLPIVDLGSGGGLLGIPVAICRPERRLTLVESNLKKCRALESFVEALGLDNVTVAHRRAEALREKEPQLFIARFFMDPRGVAIATRRARCAGSQYLLVAGPDDEAPPTIYDLHLQNSFSLSETKVALHYVVTDADC